MRVRVLALLGAALACLLASLGVAAVERLTDKTFRDATKTGHWLVAFTKEDCPHCQKLKPELDKLSEMAITKKRNVHVATVDSANSDIVADFDVRGYPAIFFLEAGQRFDYSYMRDAASLAQYLARMTSDPVTNLANSEALEKYVGESSDSRDIQIDSVSFVLFSPPPGTIGAAAVEAQATFDQVAKDKEFRGKYFLARFIASPEIVKALPKKLSFSSTGGVQLVKYSLGEDPRVIGEPVHLSKSKKLMDLIEFEQFPFVTVLGTHNFLEVAHNRAKKPVFVYISDAVNNTAQLAQLKESLRVQAKAHTDFIFGILDAVKFKSYTSQFVDDTMAQFFVYEFSRGLNYVESHRQRSIVDFLKDVREGKADYRREGLLGYPYKGVLAFNKLHAIAKAVIGACTIVPLLLCLSSCFASPAPQVRRKVD